MVGLRHLQGNICFSLLQNFGLNKECWLLSLHLKTQGFHVCLTTYKVLEYTAKTQSQKSFHLIPICHVVHPSFIGCMGFVIQLCNCPCLQMGKGEGIVITSVYLSVNACTYT